MTALARRLPVVRSRWLSLLLLLGFCVVLLIPTWLVLPPDDENLPKEVLSTFFQSRQIFSGHYAFWDPWVAFGVPEPRSQTLIFHPFMLFVQLFSLGFALGAYYQLQLWIGVLSTWAIARHLGIRRSIAALCVLTYALCSVTIVTLIADFWPVNFANWTLAPLLLWLMLKLFDAESTWSRAFFAVAVGLAAAFMVLDGHLGWLPDYALPFLAFLATQWRRLAERWRWWTLSAIVLGLAAASHVYDVALEASSAAQGRNNQEAVGMNFWRLLLYPIHAPSHFGNNTRAVAIGGPFVLLAAIGLFYPLRNRYVNGLRAGMVTAFVVWFIPLGWTPFRSTSYASGAPFAIFAVLLAALTLQALWERRPGWRAALAGLAGLQVIALVAGFYPFYRDGIREASRYLSGSTASTSLKHSLANQPIYRYFERTPGIDRTRVYFAAGADKRLFRHAVDYKFVGFPLHGLRLVNGLYKGVDMHEITPARVYLRGEIHGDPRVAGSALTLDALNVGYVLATPGDRLARTLKPMTTFQLDRPAATIGVYRNLDAWTDAVVLRPQAKALGVLPRRAGCDTPGLLCADFRPVARLRAPHGVLGERWSGADLSVKLARTTAPRVLMVSELYRPGWQAELSDGRTVSGYRLVGGFTGFDLPPGVDSARIVYEPTTRIVLTSITWATIFFGLLALAGIAVARRRRSRSASDTERSRL
jgi:hypothetical protein